MHAREPAQIIAVYLAELKWYTTVYNNSTDRQI